MATHSASGGLVFSCSPSAWWSAWRVLRRGLLATPERVVVRNLLWFRVVPTTNIERFEPAASYGLHLGTGGLVVRTLRGRDVHAGVFVSTPVDGGGGVGTAEAKELNEWLTAVKTGVRFPPGSLVPAWKAYGGAWGRRVWFAALLGLMAFLVLMIVPALLDPSSALG